MNNEKKKILGLSWLGWMLALSTVLLVIIANAHLLFVAVESQSECVPHIKEKAGGSGFRAAKSSC